MTISKFIFWYVAALILQGIVILVYRVFVPNAEFEFINAQIFAVGLAIVITLEK